MIWSVAYVLISIVSEPEGSLEISFRSFLILLLGKQGPGGWRGQGPRAAHRGTGQRARLPDPWPGAWAIKRRENDKSSWLLYFPETFHWMLAGFCFVLFFPLGEKKKSIMIQYRNSSINNSFSIPVKEDPREGHSPRLSLASHLFNQYLRSALTLEFSSEQKKPCCYGVSILVGDGVGHRKTNKEMKHLL